MLLVTSILRLLRILVFNWDEISKKKANLNAKALKALYCSQDKNEFTRISTCISAHEMWYTLEAIHEDISYVKETKINLLVYKYELFKMKPKKVLLICMLVSLILLIVFKVLEKSIRRSIRLERFFDLSQMTGRKRLLQLKKSKIFFK